MTSPNRRQFLAASALAAGSLARAARADEPAPKAAPPSERIVLGVIGVGGMGRGLTNIFKGFPDVEIAALCDVYEPHLLQARSLVGDRPDTYDDFRRVLDRKDVDAVVIATPDHWHAIPAILACQAGKDVYCEKPLSYRIAEGRAMVTAASKAKRVTQMGNLIHAGENYHRVVEIVRSGVLGRITKARVWMAADRESLGHPPDGAPPAGVNYDMWLGPAPERPFNPNRFTFNWRYFWDYAGGMLCDFCCHIVDPVHWAMEVAAPRTIAATGGRYALDDNGETPDTLEVVYHYENDGKPFDLVWSHADASSAGFWGYRLGILFQGTEASLIADYSKHEILAGKDREIALPPKTLPRSVGHHREWLDAIKTRGETSCNFEYGHRLSSVGHLGNIALWTGQKLTWDGEAERFPDQPDANRHLSREEYRAPWPLPAV